MAAKNKRLIAIVTTILVLLLVPFVSMQFTNEVNWSLSDFIVAGALLTTTGFFIELVIVKVKESKYRLIFIFLIVALLLLTWLELAVGIFGTPLSGS